MVDVEFLGFSKATLKDTIHVGKIWKDKGYVTFTCSNLHALIQGAVYFTSAMFCRHSFDILQCYSSHTSYDIYIHIPLHGSPNVYMVNLHPMYLPTCMAFIYT